MNEAASEAYDFFWNEFCDWYIEISKHELYHSKKEGVNYRVLTVLVDILLKSLKLLHPFLPFITEEIFSLLPSKIKRVEKEFIIISNYPQREARYAYAFNYILDIKNIIYGVRNIRSELGLPLHKPLQIIAECNIKLKNKILSNMELFTGIGKIEKIEFLKPDLSKGKYATYIQENYSIYVKIENLIDMDKEKNRLKKEFEKFQKELSVVQNKINNKNFVQKAKREVVEKERSKYIQLNERVKKIESRMAYFN